MADGRISGGFARMAVLGCSGILLSAFILYGGRCTDDGQTDRLPAVYSRFLAFPVPSMGVGVAFNAPVLRWPVEKTRDVTYDVRLSPDSLFQRRETILRERIPWAFFNPHQRLRPGTWYWQYRVSGTSWSPVHCFTVTDRSAELVSPPASRFISGLPANRPRVLADAASLKVIRTLAADPDASAIIRDADKALAKPVLTEKDGLPDQSSANASRNRKLQQDASKKLGDFATGTVLPLCQAYLLTGDNRYRQHALHIAKEVASWDPDGISHINDFSDARCMLAMAVAYDTFSDQLSLSERTLLIRSIAARASRFYRDWVNHVEAKVLSGHVWQHILHYFFQTAIAVYGDLPDAEKWLEYAYELFLARSPVLGGTDGGWVEGVSYFRMNMETLLDIPLYIRRYTGFDFIRAHPWYTSQVDWLIHHIPPGSAADGFGDNTEEVRSPGADYMAYAAEIARLTGNGQAAWYVQECMKYESPDLPELVSMRWIRLTKTRRLPMPPAAPPASGSGKVFREIGLVSLHSRPENTGENLAVAMRSSPFGSYGHYLSDQNAFHILYRGQPVFFRTGYKVTMNDPHRTGWYQHTRSSNSVLVDGAGQPYSSEAFGWISRFLAGEDIAYAKGDASAAYRSRETGEDYGVTRFHRHLILLKPDIIVVYDELAARRAVRWSWLLHSMAPVMVDGEQGRFQAVFDTFSGGGKLWSAGPVTWSLADTFEVRAENWRGSKGPDGKLKAYNDKQWHLKAVSNGPSMANRFFAVLQVGQGAGGKAMDERTEDGQVVVTAGRWNIRACVDTARQPGVYITNQEGTVAFTTHQDQVKIGGKTFMGTKEGSSKLVQAVNGEWQLLESTDEMPSRMRQSLLYYNKQNGRKE